jgi:hypothetical protein
MPKEVRVTRSEVEAAKRIVQRNLAKGKETSEAIRKIAEAEAEHPVVVSRQSRQSGQDAPAEPRPVVSRQSRQSGQDAPAEQSATSRDDRLPDEK